MGCLTWNLLLDAPATRHDLAWLNLKMAVGLPSAIMTSADECLKTLDRWVEFVRWATNQAFRRTRHRYPDETDAEFRMLVLASAVQRHIGVRYNQTFMEGEYDGRDACNAFLHGVLSGRGGTCVSLPVLYTVIGRRLGYPLRLVHAKQHLFCRWDDPSGERFNIESATWGYAQHDDAHYRSWPDSISDQEVEWGYLRSLMPREEAALFYALRGECYLEHLQFEDAVKWLHQAHLHHPTFPNWCVLWGVAIIMHRVFGARANPTEQLDPDAILRHTDELVGEFGLSMIDSARSDLQRIVANWRTRPVFRSPDFSIPGLTGEAT